MSSLPSFTAAKPAVGLIGFGAFGRLIASHLVPFTGVTVYDPTQPTTGVDCATGAGFAPIETVCTCDVVILATPVREIAAICRRIAPHLAAGTTVIDVGSVKMRPAQDMQDNLPANINLIGTHPLFGPQSAKDGLSGHQIALCPLRGSSHGRIAAVLRRVFGLKIIWTTPEQHDRDVATVQGLTHLISRSLAEILPTDLRLTTVSFDRLLQAQEMVREDAPAVLETILQDNPFAAEVRDAFLASASDLSAQYRCRGAGPNGAEPDVAAPTGSTTKSLQY
ncbi:prephenate dehydrogenase [Phaeobacter sp.]|uniref:prephenate dehydrogenase n=1 Tax=Phaeobacter sp. TaxID=1902409 RepID=UPI0025D65B11|nr:prephenate dehydrogenase [Phaeobacter sp.]